MLSINLKKYFLWFLFFVIVLLLLQIDDSLSEDAQKAVDANNGNGTSQAFLYLLGFGAGLDEDPIEKGKKILTKIREHEKTYDLADEVEPFSIDSDLDLPKNDLFCAITGSSKCLNSIFDIDNIDIDNSVHNTLKSRYVEYLQLGDFQNLTVPHSNEPLPYYGYLRRANNLTLIEAVKLAKQCCPEQASENLYVLIDSLKKHHESLNSLIDTMINLRQINETIEVLSMLVREHKLPASKISFLTRDQLSMEKAINREFVNGKNSAYKKLHNGMNLKWTPSWLDKIFMKAVIKENITSNAIFKAYSAHIKVSELPQSDFQFHVGESSKLELEKSWVRNLIGTILSGVAVPDFDMYIARGFDINAKIALFNGILGKKVTPELIKDIQNPYYKDSDHKAYIDKENNRVCFEGPMEDKRGFRCLSLREK